MDGISAHRTFEAVVADPAYSTLVDVLVAGAYGFIGAGVNVQVGMPGWTSVLDDLREKARLLTGKSIEPEKDNPLLVAQECVDALGAAVVADVIRRLYARPANTVIHAGFHERLVALPFYALLTTNYDLVLESAIAGTGRAVRTFDWDDDAARAAFAHGLVERPADPTVAHLHGSVRRPEKVVLGQRSYDGMYRRDTALSSGLMAVMTVRRLVFIGYGLEDPPLMQVLDCVRALQDPGAPKHIAILPSNREVEDQKRRRELLGNYRVQPLFYDRADHHAQLDQIIERLHVDVRKRIAERVAREGRETI